MPPATRLRGSCHCGGLRVSVSTCDASALALRACQCSFCRKHGARTFSDPAGFARVIVRGDALVRYRFARKATDMLVCRDCGVYVGALIEDGDRALMTVNANALDDRARFAGEATPMTYDAETDDARLARRRARWTPAEVVSIVAERSDAPDGRALLAAYFDELRAAIPDFDPALSVSADPDEMVAPRGAFLVVRAGGVPVACGGLKTHAPWVGEIKRMYTAPSARGHGLGRDLLEALEHQAKALGMRRVVLDTGAPLDAAARLYLAAGYVEVPPFNDNRFATKWFAKDLA